MVFLIMLWNFGKNSDKFGKAFNNKARSVGPVRRAGRFCSGLRGRKRTYLTILNRALPILKWYGMVCPPATPEAGANRTQKRTGPTNRTLLYAGFSFCFVILAGKKIIQAFCHMLCSWNENLAFTTLKIGGQESRCIVCGVIITYRIQVLRQNIFLVFFAL
jgi:hypothetical protein